MTIEKPIPTEETIAASELYGEKIRVWSAVHSDFSHGKATIEEDRKADTERKQAFQALRDLEATLVAKQEFDGQIHRSATAVANVVVRCPKTDKFFPTGVACDPASFESATFENNSSQCPHCGMMHRWGDSEIALDN